MRAGLVTIGLAIILSTIFSGCTPRRSSQETSERPVAASESVESDIPTIPRESVDAPLPMPGAPLNSLIGRFEGSGGSYTAPFMVPFTRWRVDWQTVSDQKTDFLIELRDPITNEIVDVLVNKRVDSATGYTFVLGEEGPVPSTFKLFISGPPLEQGRWSVTLTRYP